MHPLKNVGKRGEQKWQQISWDEALDEIAVKLQTIIAKYGPETVALSNLSANAGADQGMIRRFMNLLGTPNYITGLAMCLGNTAQIHRTVFGNHIGNMYEKANCIVLVGHNPHRDNWPGEYARLKQALGRGAKLIVLDPRKSNCAEMADIHLPLRYGTDAAMLLGWLNVIINEELYDKEFVKNWTVGFAELAERVQQYPTDKVAEITGCDESLIRQAARMYATAGPSVIPWGAIADMQVNSTSVIRCQDILLSICGYLNKTELLVRPSPDLITASEIEDHAALPVAKQKLQLGTENYPLFTYTGLASLAEPTKRVYGHEYLNVVSSYMAHPPTVFKAMCTGKPYPVKAFFTIGSNPLMGFANQQRIYDGLMNQELVVVFDHLMTPTAQLADYVLPGDSWLERPELKNRDHMPQAAISQQILDAPGECKNQYDLIRGLAVRLGLGQHFPWKTLTEVFDYRLSKLGISWAECEHKAECEHNPVLAASKPFDPFTSGTGLATPSGKVELYSSVLAGLGYDPLPYYKEPAQTPISNPDLAKEYPLTLFAGLREGPFYNTNLRHVDSLRRALPDPLTLLNPQDGLKFGLADGDWVWVETTHGRVKMKTSLDSVQPAGTIRVPHGWWMAELEPGLESGLSGAMVYNDGMILSDDDWNLDREQGLPNLRGGILAKAYKV
jgi:anaerobic selenocysteine-containing dehydrogenase